MEKNFSFSFFFFCQAKLVWDVKTSILILNTLLKILKCKVFLYFFIFPSNFKCILVFPDISCLFLEFSLAFYSKKLFSNLKFLIFYSIDIIKFLLKQFYSSYLLGFSSNFFFTSIISTFQINFLRFFSLYLSAYPSLLSIVQFHGGGTDIQTMSVR